MKKLICIFSIAALLCVACGKEDNPSGGSGSTLYVDEFRFNY